MKSEEQIRQLAFYDPLTGLANRRLLREAIQHELLVAKRHKHFGTLLYLDLDNFKTLNDSLGHAIGDELLIQLSERLKSAIRKDDIVSRLGGDEFVVLLSGESPTRHQAMDQALNNAQKIQSTINESYKLHGYEHVVTTSMGITIYPENNDLAEDVLKPADAAMYRAKAAGRNSICFYNPDMQLEADNRLLLEKELRTAITDNQFEMYYQPLVDYNGSIIGVEALIRWMHPSRGVVSPAEFIPIVEETGLILELGNWILYTACKFCISSNINHIAVNISPMQFRQVDFIESTTQILKETGVNPEYLMFELTEGIVIENIDDTINKMNSLKKMGIRISIDDFGTGYSSLAYLKQLPIDQLKINNEFVRDINTDPNDAIIVETIISMANHLGLDVVAEGVETDSQLQFLDEKGCQIFQGHYFSIPLPKDKFINYLSRRLEMSL
ncbi:MAG: EAL domain-containing protein [Halobacteria archaeon]|nr:EAL domain-containing protein [Halobacteria archaeon]